MTAGPPLFMIFRLNIGIAKPQHYHICCRPAQCAWWWAWCFTAPGQNGIILWHCNTAVFCCACLCTPPLSMFRNYLTNACGPLRPSFSGQFRGVTTMRHQALYSRSTGKILQHMVSGTERDSYVQGLGLRIFQPSWLFLLHILYWVSQLKFLGPCLYHGQLFLWGKVCV